MCSSEALLLERLDEDGHWLRGMAIFISTHLCSKVRPRIFPSRIPGNYTCVAVAKELENLGIANDTRSVD